MRAFLDKWLLSFCISFSAGCIVALFQPRSVVMFMAAFLSVAASLLITFIILWPQMPKRIAVSADDDQSPVRRAPPPEWAPKWFTPHSLCSLYKNFQKQDADKIVEPHQNKLMTVTGKVVYFDARYLYLERKCLWSEDRVRASFGFDKPDCVTALLMGKKVKVRGRLICADDRDITLWGCELLKAPKDSHFVRG